VGRRGAQRTHDLDPQGGTAQGGGNRRGQATGAAAHRGNPPPRVWSTRRGARGRGVGRLRGGGPDGVGSHSVATRWGEVLGRTR